MPGFLTSFGLNLLATPPQGNIFQTAATAAREPFDQLQASQARQRALQAEKEFLRSERLAGQEFEEGQLQKRLESAEKIAAMKSDEGLSVNQLASTYLDDYDGDLNKATNKAKFFLEVRPQLAGTVGETQIGGIIEADLSNEKQAKTFARANRNKVGKVFWDINTGTLKKLVKDPETKALGFVDFFMTGEMQPDTEGETLPEERVIKSPGLYGQETKPPKKLKEVLPDLRDTGFDEDFYQM
jgi:type II secretory pathway pseudopilin PulG